jgi:hypothetical protein
MQTLMQNIMKVYTKEGWLMLSINYRMYVRVNYLRRMQIRQRKPVAQVFYMSDYR